MRLIITGGGTGGHVYPALEVGRAAQARGHELLYLGSLRGQEGAACASEGIAFQGFPSEPLYSIRTFKGVKAAFKLLSAMSGAKKVLRHWKPDVVFSTGGYSAAPVINAARSLHIPYVLLEANSVPGRSNAIFAKQAKAVATVFRATEKYLLGSKIVRTGMPVRKALRDAAATKCSSDMQNVLIIGGSQGSEFLNSRLPEAASEYRGPNVHWRHVAGKAHVEAVLKDVLRRGLKDYEVVPFLGADEMAQAYARATLVVGRSGGSLAEVALFGLPSVLVPLPTAAGNHQTRNAEEFVEMGAATIHRQETSTSARLAKEIEEWLVDAPKRDRASQATRAFDAPDATEQIMTLIEEAGK